MVENLDICHVLNSVRGTSIVVDIANQQQQTDDIDSVGVLAWYDAKPFSTDKQLEVHSLDVPNGTIHITPTQYRKAKDIISNYDIIHTHRNHSGFYAKLIAKETGKPIIVTHHNDHNGFTYKGRVANGITNLFANEVVCVSESVHDSFALWERILTRDHKVNIIHNGINLSRVEAAKSLEWSIHDKVNIDRDAIVVGSAGMLTEQKAHDVLIESIDRVNNKSEQPVELVISGDGELYEYLEAQIADAEYNDRLHLLGFLEDREQVYKMMHEIDIYAMPSRWEGFCLAVLEAMAQKNPCVLSNLKVFQEVYGDSVLYHDVNDPQSLADQILNLMSNPDEFDMYRRKSQKLSSIYTMEKTADRYIELYKSVI